MITTSAYVKFPSQYSTSTYDKRICPNGHVEHKWWNNYEYCPICGEKLETNSIESRSLWDNCDVEEFLGHDKMILLYSKNYEEMILIENLCPQDDLDYFEIDSQKISIKIKIFKQNFKKELELLEQRVGSPLEVKYGFFDTSNFNQL